MKEICTEVLEGFMGLPKGGRILIGVVVLVLLLLGSAKVFADDDPPKTTLTICDGGLPSTSLLGSAQGGCHSVDVTATDPLHFAQIAYQAQSFMHIYRTSGDPACIYTKDSRGRPDAGRDCRPEDHQCAFIAMGWHTYAITGQSCQQAGIAECEGLYCI